LIVTRWSFRPLSLSLSVYYSCSAFSRPRLLPRLSLSFLLQDPLAWIHDGSDGPDGSLLNFTLHPRQSTSITSIYFYYRFFEQSPPHKKTVLKLHLSSWVSLAVYTNFLFSFLSLLILSCYEKRDIVVRETFFFSLSYTLLITVCFIAYFFFLVGL